MEILFSNYALVCEASLHTASFLRRTFVEMQEFQPRLVQNVVNVTATDVSRLKSNIKLIGRKCNVKPI